MTIPQKKGNKGPKPTKSTTTTPTTTPTTTRAATEQREAKAAAELLAEAAAGAGLEPGRVFEIMAKVREPFARAVKPALARLGKASAAEIPTLKAMIKRIAYKFLMGDDTPPA